MFRSCLPDDAVVDIRLSQRQLTTVNTPIYSFNFLRGIAYNSAMEQCPTEQTGGSWTSSFSVFIQLGSTLLVFDFSG